MTYAIGSLVRTRGREWVVLPESSDELLLLRPLGGTDDEIAGVCTALESVEPASFDLPDPAQVGDYRSCRFLRDALRLGFRSSAGPFRSFGRIAVEPRPYQLVPLLMALQLDPVRILIADDVGVGKTVEAALIARELLDRGECQALCVLCPPHLAEQWQRELAEKFHIDARLVLPSTVHRLERECRANQSIFDVHPFTVVSIDYIKSDRRRDEFIRTCPNLVILDEAHSCAWEQDSRAGRHQRYTLVKDLAADENRHMIFVTATPHSGKEAAFRSLLSFVNKDFANLPDELSGPENEPYRRRLAAHFVQRRRADIRHFLDKETVFPSREDREEHYKLTPEYKDLFDRVLNYAREIVADKTGGQHRMRVRWWSALALLRSLASSPAAAAATLRSRSASAETLSWQEADEVGQRMVLDQEDHEAAETPDVAPGSDPGEEAASDGSRRLLELARQAEKLAGDKDAKLTKAVSLLKQIIHDGYNPIVFCRFIPTAEYLAEELRQRLGNRVAVTAVTGLLPPEEREIRVRQLAESSPRVLVCTDCLSEGINLQQYFNAVVHYDLSWNPTRHEQRDGRVDRYGQASPTVRSLIYYGIDNQIDGLVLDVLLRKHKAIRSSLGISVPVPADTNAVVEAIFEGLLLRERAGARADDLLPGFEQYLQDERARLHTDWENASQKEKRSRTMFAQEGIQARVGDVARELEAVRSAIGSARDVESFTRDALRAYGAFVTDRPGFVEFDLRQIPRALRETCGFVESFKAKFELPVDPGVLYLGRTHPIVEGLAQYVLNAALDGEGNVARRCGAIRTDAVDRWTTLLLLRYRYHIVTHRGEQSTQLLAEDSQLLAFAGAPDKAQWLDAAKTQKLQYAEPKQNITPSQAADFVRKVIDRFEHLRPRIEQFARQRGQELLDAHRRVREAARMRGVRYEIRPELPADVLGIYVFLPAGA
ncbi:helicase-related protein [Fontivita pretiosa]|uniref:helicase-related protein n=1 Tax=Fontivita pretiosa TaxID=2989684 RepID=UPI003D18264F